MAATREQIQDAVETVDALRRVVAGMDPRRRIASMIQALAEEIDEAPITMAGKHEMIALAVQAMTAVVDGVEFGKVTPS